MLLYFIPYSYLAVYGDVNFGSMALYLLPVAAFSLLCYVTLKAKSIWYLILGNILSFVSSYACVHLFVTEKWEWYFKPLTGEQLVTVISFLAILLQCKACYVVDILPPRVDEKDFDKFLEIEEYYFQPEELRKLAEKFANILIKLYLEKDSFPVWTNILKR